jgi:hypothetical protein
VRTSRFGSVSCCGWGSPRAGARAGLALVPSRNCRAHHLHAATKNRPPVLTLLLPTPLPNAAADTAAADTAAAATAAADTAAVHTAAAAADAADPGTGAGSLRILVFSGDIDAIVPVIGSRRWVAALGRPVLAPWKAWTSSTKQVGGDLGAWY